MIKINSSKLEFEILISTMNRISLDFLVKMFPFGDYHDYHILIVNQTNKKALLSSDKKNIRVINSFEKGLSLSRNRAIANTLGTICLLADDDVIYKQDFKATILNAFKEYLTADIITFKMHDLEGNNFKDYSNKIVHDKETIKTINSVVIALKSKEILENKIKFNINFGLGSHFQTADEYVFLRDALKVKLNMFFNPKIILSHDYNSSGRDSGSDHLVYARAALFYKYSGNLAYIRLLKYLFLIYKKEEIKFIEIFSKYRTGMRGIKKYKYLLSTKQETK